ncbi:hypothetical protein EYF80_047508 [Liparis tanakae]|uniref:Uncharacterized protein n=1 Tax=Liparis tanakae TaxID=230148 RepID=A0A4Z2FM42_9TELE|nr:hypothetical protein EYF80_047508 [Liparis tanakae]
MNQCIDAGQRPNLSDRVGMSQIYSVYTLASGINKYPGCSGAVFTRHTDTISGGGAAALTS